MLINKNLHLTSKINKFPKFLHPALFVIREILSRILYFIIKIKDKKKFDGISTIHNLPFLNNNFKNVYKKIQLQINNQSLHKSNKILFRCHQLCYFLDLARNVEGDILELGVAKGFQFLFAKEFLKNKLNKKIYLIDTFLPNAIDPSTGKQDNINLLNQGIKLGYAQSFENTKENFKNYEQFILVQGSVPEVLKDINLEKISFIHIDLNYAKAEYEAYDFLWDKLSTGGIILSDDFAYHGHEEQMKKTIEFFDKKNHPILTLATGQGLIIKK